jgi:hypothetical protein
MEFEPHIGQNAELYAVGALDAEERAAVDEHIAQCAECLRRVGEAEETVLALERVTIPPSPAARGRASLRFARRGISAWWLPVAAAAALIVGLFFPRPVMQHDVAMLAMLHSHFAHSQFTGTGAPPAKVLYARDRSWYYVIVAGNHRFEVYGRIGASATNLGSTQPRGATSEVFVRVAKRFDTIELRDRGTAVETAAIR